MLEGRVRDKTNAIVHDSVVACAERLIPLLLHMMAWTAVLRNKIRPTDPVARDQRCLASPQKWEQQHTLDRLCGKGSQDTNDTSIQKWGQPTNHPADRRPFLV